MTTSRRGRRAAAGQGGDADSALEFINFTGAATDVTVYTLALSGSVTNKYCVVGITSRDNNAQSISSVTVDGQSCSLVVAAAGGTSSSGDHACIYITDARVTFASSADVVVTYSGGMKRICVAVAAVDISSTTAVTTGTSVGVDPANLDVSSISVGDIIIACGHEGQSQSATYDWSASDSEITDHGDGIYGQRTISMATGIATSTSVTVRANSDNPNAEHGTVAVFSPA